MNSSHKLFFTTLLSLVCFFSTAAVLKDGLDIPVRLAQNVNGNMNFTGETVYFQVTEDVMVDSEVVIAAGTFVKGMVQEAVGRKSMGKGGVLTLVPRSLVASNGDLVKFERNPLSQEGRKRTGATVAHVVMWGPLGLFAKGRAAYMFRDTEFDITVDGKYDLPPIPAKQAAQQDIQSFPVAFQEYKSKINYRKGKTGKDFMVTVTDSEDYKIRNLEITAVDGHKLPKAIKPTSISNDRKNNGQKILTFAFSDIIKYAVPESSEFEFTIGDAYQATAQLNTRWKLK